MELNMHGTTILAVQRNGRVAIGGDGQVTMGQVAIKHSAVKVRRLFESKVIAGFAGSTADAMTLFEKFEGKLQEYRGNLVRSSLELAKEWRTDRMLRRLEALLLVADKENLFMLSGVGDVISPDQGIIGIGSGGAYAEAAARALLQHTELSAREIVDIAIKIAAAMCVYTNSQIVIEELL